ncbi:MAG: hypothetical protein ABFS18_05190 [Thermodesulfobacteriota bacterium]
MKGGLEIIIRSDCFVLTCDRGNIVEEELRQDEVDVAAALTSCCEKHGLRARTVNLFLAEELIYMTAIDLPTNTPKIGEAVSFQLGALAPFPEDDVLYSYSTVRDGDNFRVTIAAARSARVVAVVEELLKAGFVVKGLYPESQRYVTAKWRKLRWALVVPGGRTKIFVFDGGQYADRFLGSGADLDYDELAAVCDTENIFHLSPPVGSNFKSVQLLMAAPPLLKEHNMLPASYRRLDYLKIAIITLVVLNLVGLAALGSFKFLDQTKQINRADQEIARLQPLVRKAKKAKKQIRQTEAFLDLVSKMKGNPDLFIFLEKLTLALPEGSYLNQLRLTAAEGLVVINGFTDNVGDLTEKLQTVGEARLQSTSRRKNMTYFQVEISLR